MQYKIIVINGIAQAGKDTFCFFCNLFLRTKVLSTIDTVKLIAKQRFGWDGVKDEKGRRLLSDLQLAWNHYNWGALNDVAIQIPGLIKEQYAIIYIMIRKHFEIEQFLQMCPEAKVLFMHRPGITIGPTEQSFLDMIPSDFSPDYSVVNASDLSELLLQAYDFCVLLYGEHVEYTRSQAIALSSHAARIALQFDIDRGYV